MSSETMNIWSSSVGESVALTPADLTTYATVSSNHITNSTLNNISPNIIYYNEAESITEPALPCENLGEFLLKKYNKEKICKIA